MAEGKDRAHPGGVIAGFTAPKGGRNAFGALVLGAFEDGEFIFIGHTGAGSARRSGKKSARNWTRWSGRNAPLRQSRRPILRSHG